MIFLLKYGINQLGKLAFDGAMKLKILKFQNLKIPRVNRPFERKLKTFYLVSKVLSFRLRKAIQKYRNIKKYTAHQKKKQTNTNKKTKLYLCVTEDGYFYFTKTVKTMDYFM